MQQPLLSVIIPVYNRPDSLKKAVSSALAAISAAQTVRPFRAEILVIDDGSDIPVVLNTEQHTYRSLTGLKVIRKNHNGGVGKARNLGIASARGKYISFLDSDDTFLPNRFSADLDFMNQFDVEFCFGTTLDERAVDLDWQAPKRKDSLTRFTGSTPVLGKLHASGRHGHIHLNTITILRNALLSSGICFSTLKRSQDTIFIHECLDNLYALPNPETRPIAKRIYHEGNSLKINRKGTLLFLWKSIISKASLRTKFAVIVNKTIQQPKNNIVQWLRN